MFAGGLLVLGGVFAGVALSVVIHSVLSAAGTPIEPLPMPHIPRPHWPWTRRGGFVDLPARIEPYVEDDLELRWGEN